MSPEADRFIDKAHKCLRNARTILAAGVGEDAGRGAYLAGFHAAQALIFEATGKVAKTHKGVQTEFARLTRGDSRFSEKQRIFLSQTYNLKSIADYETGPGSEITTERAAAALSEAEGFVELIVTLITASGDTSGQ